jgi:hypothetical protein
MYSTQIIGALRSSGPLSLEEVQLTAQKSIFQVFGIVSRVILTLHKIVFAPMRVKLISCKANNKERERLHV